jgi:hypothetical protein
LFRKNFRLSKTGHHKDVCVMGGTQEGFLTSGLDEKAWPA